MQCGDGSLGSGMYSFTPACGAGAVPCSLSRVVVVVVLVVVAAVVLVVVAAVAAAAVAVVVLLLRSHPLRFEGKAAAATTVGVGVAAGLLLTLAVMLRAAAEFDRDLVAEYARRDGKS